MDTDPGFRPPPWASSGARTPAVGTRIGDLYRVQRVLGEGGMGVVVLALDVELQREVAIKLIHPEHAADPSLRSRFSTEARAMARVDHPNSTRVFAFGDHDGRPYFVMEYVPGADLGRWMASKVAGGGQLSVDEAVGIIEQLGRGLAAIHRAGASHGDIKPSNVLVGPGFRVVLTDMGLARLVDCGACGPLVIAGTPTYMAPELGRGEVVDLEGAKRADMYALGVLAYQLLAGKLPFEGKTTQALLHQHIYERPPSLLLARPELPPIFDQVIQRCLAKDPLERTPDPDSLRRALAAAREQVALALPPLRILIADDDPGSLRWSSELLREEFPDAEIVCVGDGERALEVARHWQPTLILSDLHMPRMNGAELTSSLGEVASLQHVPVIVMTGVGGASDWQVLRRLGAEGFLVKPVDPFALVGAVRRLAGRSTSR